MYSWHFLSQFSCVNPPTIVLKRSSTVQCQYEKYLENIDVCLLSKIFGDENKDIVLRDNDFPYNCEYGIKHRLVWIHPKYNGKTEELIKYIESIGDNIIYFENLDSNKSVKSIRHFHVFIKND